MCSVGKLSVHVPVGKLAARQSHSLKAMHARSAPACVPAHTTRGPTPAPALPVKNWAGCLAPAGGPQTPIWHQGALSSSQLKVASDLRPCRSPAARRRETRRGRMGRQYTPFCATSQPPAALPFELRVPSLSVTTCLAECRRQPAGGRTATPGGSRAPPQRAH